MGGGGGVSSFRLFSVFADFAGDLNRAETVLPTLHARCCEAATSAEFAWLEARAD